MDGMNIMKKKKLFLLDIDGTICTGETLIEGAVDFLDEIRKRQGQFVFITNNSTKGCRDYIEKFRKLGIETDAQNFVTATTATVRYLKKHYQGKMVYVMGTESFLEELRKHNILFTTDHKNEDIACVLVAYDNEMTYQKIQNTCEVLSTKEVDYLATNPDLVCPIDFGFIPDCGSICQMIEHATKKTPKYIGKPEIDMVDIALTQNTFTKEETLVVGDRLYTDIACGINAGVDTALVLTGEATKEDTENTNYKPTYIYPTITELYMNWNA